MKLLEKTEKANRVMVQVLPMLGNGRKGKGSKSFTVLNSNVDEVYTLLIKALKQAEKGGIK